MKHKFNFLITAYFLITAHLCFAMEKEPYIFRELTCVKKPRQAIYLTENQIAVRDKKGCSIIAPLTDETVITITDQKCQHLALHPKEPLLSLAHGNNLTIFNHKLKEPVCTTSGSSYIMSSIFNPFRKTIFLKYRKGGDANNDHVVEYDYKANKNIPIDVSCYPTAFHLPKKMIYTIPDTERGTAIYAYQLDNSLSIPTIYLPMECPNNCQCSPDGSVFAADNSLYIYLFNYSTKTQIHLKGSIDNELFETIQFNPNSSILAALSKHDKKEFILYYWDVATQQLINRTPLPEIMSSTTIIDYVPSTICFSCNGANIVIMANKKYINIPIPFEVLYQDDTRQKFPYLLFLLNNLKHDQCNLVPQDLIPQLKNNLLELFKR